MYVFQDSGEIDELFILKLPGVSVYGRYGVAEKLRLFVYNTLRRHLNPFDSVVGPSRTRVRSRTQCRDHDPLEDRRWRPVRNTETDARRRGGPGRVRDRVVGPPTTGLGWCRTRPK